MSIKLTTEQFKQKAREVHGDLYDYKLVEYQNNKAKVSITCKSHGVFEQIPSSHLKGSGCKNCASEILAKLQSAKAALEFSNKAKEVHNNKYDYSLVDYKNNKSKVSIICKQHGIYHQIPTDHLRGHRMRQMCCGRFWIQQN